VIVDLRAIGLAVDGHQMHRARSPYDVGGTASRGQAVTTSERHALGGLRFSQSHIDRTRARLEDKSIVSVGRSRQPLAEGLIDGTSDAVAVGRERQRDGGRSQHCIERTEQLTGADNAPKRGAQRTSLRKSPTVSRSAAP
jgi:hypothetical protein